MIRKKKLMIKNQQLMNTKALLFSATHIYFLSNLLTSCTYVKFLVSHGGHFDYIRILGGGGRKSSTEGDNTRWQLPGNATVKGTRVFSSDFLGLYLL